MFILQAKARLAAQAKKAAEKKKAVSSAALAEAKARAAKLAKKKDTKSFNQVSSRKRGCILHEHKHQATSCVCLWTC